MTGSRVPERTTPPMPTLPSANGLADECICSKRGDHIRRQQDHVGPRFAAQDCIANVVPVIGRELDRHIGRLLSKRHTGPKTMQCRAGGKDAEWGQLVWPHGLLCM